MTYGSARGMRIEGFHSDAENSHRRLAELMNEWLARHQRAEVLDVKFQYDTSGPVWNHSALIVYREAME